MKPAMLVAVAAFALATAVGAASAGQAPAVQAPTIPAHIAAALADPSRPAADRERDAERKAAALTAFTGVKPGDQVADIYPGGGYFSRIFAKAAGPSGHVYLVQPEAGVGRRPALAESARTLAGSIGNASVLVQDMTRFKPPRPLDVFFSSQFYHDMLAPNYGGPDIAAQNKAVFDALKPGGVYVIVDHSGPNGSGVRDIATTHRIDEAAVKQQMLAAGFVLDAQSDMLRNPADPRTANVFSPDIRGKTDQMVLRFRKPAR